MNLLGIKEPECWKQTLRHAYLDNGMHYELFESELGLVVAVDHVDVGLIKWYSLTEDQWDELYQNSIE